MVPLIVLLVSFILFRLLDFWVPYFADWRPVIRAALGAMFVLTGSAHWGKRRPDLVRMVPRGLGSAEMWVTVTGIAELLIAAGLQVPPLALPAAAAAGLMLICVFPANMKAARERLTIGGRSVPTLIPRLVIQLVFLAALAGAVWR